MRSRRSRKKRRKPVEKSRILAGGTVAVGARDAAGEPDYLIPLMAFVLTCIGLVMVFSASGDYSFLRYQDSAYFLKRGVLWLLISLVGMFAAWFIDYRALNRLAVPVLAAAVFLLALVLIPGVGHEANGAVRWLRFGMFNVHPGEISKLALVIFLAAYTAEHRQSMREPARLIVCAGALVLPALLILCQPDFGLVMLLVVVTLAMAAAGGANLMHIACAGAAISPAAALLVWLNPARLQRIIGFLRPDADPGGNGFQILQSLIAIESGGMFGNGLGLSRQKFFIPEQHTDFIFSIFAEEFGFAGMLFLIAVYVLLAYRGFRVALECDNHFGMMLAFGISFAIAFQAFVNMGVAVNLLPVTGLTLPFVSFGGSSLMVCYVGIGLLMSVSTQNGRRRRMRRAGAPA
ncbi:MAG: putative lipid II flippase FtsW [bacterium]